MVSSLAALLSMLGNIAQRLSCLWARVANLNELPGNSQINVVGHLDLADSVVNITNPGFHLPPNPNGGIPTSAGNICANVYVFDPLEQLLECCSCPVSRNGVKSLSVKNDLTNNPITGVTPTSITIKLVATIPPGGVDQPSTCDASKLPSSTVALGANGGFSSGMRAWATHVHSVATSAGGPLQFATETEFSQVPLSVSERAVLGTRCQIIIGNGSGAGICTVCRLGAL
jgi:hypothetical protein